LRADRRASSPFVQPGEEFFDLLVRPFSIAASNFVIVLIPAK
jgi:hypothetical protein